MLDSLGTLRLTFLQPWWLLLIPVLLPPLVLLSLRSLAGLGKVRRAMAIAAVLLPTPPLPPTSTSRVSSLTQSAASKAGPASGAFQRRADFLDTPAVCCLPSSAAIVRRARRPRGSTVRAAMRITERHEANAAIARCSKPLRA